MAKTRRTDYERLRDLARVGAEVTLRRLCAEIIAIERAFPELKLSEDVDRSVALCIGRRRERGRCQSKLAGSSAAKPANSVKHKRSLQLTSLQAANRSAADAVQAIVAQTVNAIAPEAHYENAERTASRVALYRSSKRSKRSSRCTWRCGGMRGRPLDPGEMEQVRRTCLAMRGRGTDRCD